MIHAPWWQVVRQDAARLIVKISGPIPAKDDGLCALLASAKVAEIVVRLDSTGGAVPLAMDVHRALKANGARVVVRIEGEASSAAGLIACAAHVVQAAPDATWLIHAPTQDASGPASALRFWARRLDEVAREMATTYAAKSGRTVAEFLALLTDGEDHRLSADDALRMGLVDVLLLPVAGVAL